MIGNGCRKCDITKAECNHMELQCGECYVNGYRNGRLNAIDECIEKLYEMTPYSHEQKLDMVFVNALKQLKGETE